MFIIRASFLSHLFGEKGQFEVGKRLAALLDPRPGSIIFCSRAGMPKKGQPNEIYPMFCHSQESWTEVWGEQIFKRGRVKVHTVLMEMDIASEQLESVSD